MLNNPSRHTTYFFILVGLVGTVIVAIAYPCLRDALGAIAASKLVEQALDLHYSWSEQQKFT